jgi:Ni,Fe-hydrogenase III small subunit
MWCSVFVGKVVQPQQWVAPVEAIPGCPPGLEYLTGLDQILVKQQIDLLESMG